MADENTDAYMGKPDTATPVVVTASTPATKKRKKSPTVTEATSDLKIKAQLYCSGPEQWRILSRYSPLRLSEWIQDKEFDRSAVFRESIFDFVHRTLALICDTVGGGQGYIENELVSDMSLRAALDEEISSVIGFLTNRLKIGVLMAADVTNGKRRQWKEAPVQEPILEEIHDATGDDYKTDTPVVVVVPIPDKEHSAPDDGGTQDVPVDHQDPARIS
jgi:hypothetical protein